MPDLPTQLRRPARRIASALVPRRLKARLADVPLAQRLAGRRLVEPVTGDAATRLKARTRWTSAEPEVALTWGVQLSGEGFVSKLKQHTSLTAESRLMEVGPGYGRLLSAALGSGLPFASYHGIDVSAKNVEHLRDRFDDGRLSFVVGDIEEIAIPQFDVGFSSLVMKHLYPDCAAAIRNIAPSVAPGGRFVFDLIEGSTSFFEFDEQTFVRRYERHEIQEILERAGMGVLAWDIVKHDDDVRHDRLLVVAGPSDA